MNSSNPAGLRRLPGMLIAVLATALISAGCSGAQDGNRTGAEATPARAPELTLHVVPLESPTPVDAATATAAPARSPVSSTPAAIDGPSSHEDSAYIHLYTVMDKHTQGSALRLLDSYEPTATWDDGDSAWVYDNALVMLALMARGTLPDWERARTLADSLIFAQDHDPVFADGRLRDAYSATRLASADGKARFAVPGSATGNMAWAIIAWLGYSKAKGGAAYLNAAVRLGQWLYDNTYDVRGNGGYTGGYSDGLSKQQWKATEHNIDISVAFMKLYEATGDPVWSSRARHARDFVHSMWNEAGGHFWTGTTNDGATINTSPVPEDVQTWGLMALGQADVYGAGVTWAESHLSVSPCVSSSTVKGFKFSDAGQGCWFEGIAHMAIAFQIMGRSAKADEIVQVLRTVQTSAPNNNQAGIVAAYPDEAPTGYGWSYPNALHIGATAWYLFAERRFNPFWQIDTSVAIPIIRIQAGWQKNSVS